MATRLPCRTWLLVLPLLIGALLLMHGLDAHAGGSHRGEGAGSAPVVAGHSHDEPVPVDHAHCVDCLAGHVMVACVAAVTAVGGLGLVRRLLTPSTGAALAPAAVTGRVRGLVEAVRPPDPAWVRLSVMRC